MFNQLELTNIKSFRSATIPLGNFTVLVGTNASGKSNIRDVFRFLHGVGRGYRLIEILAEKYEGGDRVWSGIRGGPTEFCYSGSNCARISASVTTIPGYFDALHDTVYAISLQPNGVPSQLKICEESLRVGSDTIYITGPNGDPVAKPTDARHIAARLLPAMRNRERIIAQLLVDEPLLHQVADHLLRNKVPEPPFTILQDLLDERAGDLPVSEIVDQVVVGTSIVRERLSRIRFLDLHPDTLRLPSYSGQNTLGDRGENLSSALKYVVEDLNKRLEVVEWLKALTPMDVVDVEFASDLNGRTLLYLIENDGRKTSATSASDGTLRFLAYIALLFSEDQPITCFIEEIENGIHPARLNLLVDLIESQSAKQGIQVIATTHSPTLLGLLGERSLHDALLIYRSEITQSSRVMALHDLTRFDEIARKRSPGYLMETSWMENTVSALEYDEVGPSEAP